MFTLAISCVITSNLPWFMDLTFQVPMQYCSLQHWTYFHHQSHPQLGVVFVLLHLFILSGVIFPLFSSSIVGTLNWGVYLSVSYHFAFSYCSWGSEGKNTEVVCHSFLQWTIFCQNFPPWLVHLGWPYMAWLIVSLSYTRLWSMWSVWLIFCDCGFHAVCLLMDGDKRLMEASWRERLTEVETGSSDGWGCVQ